MGALLSFTGRVDVSDVFVDFESRPRPPPQFDVLTLYIIDCEPGDDERNLCLTADEILDQAPSMIERLENYENCGTFIRKALSNPNPQTERDAFNAVKKNVEIINAFYIFSKETGTLRVLLSLV